MVTDDIEVAGTRLHVRTWGQGPPLYLIHGGPGGSGSYWSSAVPYLGQIRTVHAIDLRGHGLSARTPPYSIERMAEDVRALAKTMGHRTYGLMGHSFGSLVAMAAAMDGPEVSELVLVGGFANTRRMLMHPGGLTTKLRLGVRLLRWNIQHIRGTAPPLRVMLRRLLRDARPLLHGAGADAARIDAVLGASVVDPLDAVVPLQRSLVGWDVRERLPRIGARTLVVVGGRDALAGPSARGMTRAIPGARLVRIRGAGHSPFFDRPHRFRAVVEAFLAPDGPE